MKKIDTSIENARMNQQTPVVTENMIVKCEDNIIL